MSNFRIAGQSLIKENCHYSRTSNDIDMKLRPVTKLGKINKKSSKEITMTSFRKIVTSSQFFRFVANLEQSGSRISNAQSVKLTFSLIVTFYLTKMKTKLKGNFTFFLAPPQDKTVKSPPRLELRKSMFKWYPNSKVSL